MDHETAVRLDASQRYVLGEISPGEKDQFEEHLADCSRCMEDVWAGKLFGANAKAEFEDRAANPRAQAANRWFDRFRMRPVPVLAFSGVLNVALLAIVGIGLVRVVPTLETRLRERDQPVAAQVFRLRGVSRGPSQLFAVKGGYAILRLDLPHRYRHYSYAIEDGAAQVRRSGGLVVPTDADELDLTVPTAGLDAGDYHLKVMGSDGAQPEEIAACVIRVESKKMRDAS